MNKQVHVANKRIVVVDVETTGLSVRQGGRVIEVGALALENGVVVAEFNSLICTGTPISYGAYSVHGISEKMLVGQPKPAKVWAEFCDLVGKAPLVAHNAPFDRAFIHYELSRIGVMLCNPWYCTLQLARKRLPDLLNHRLDTVYCHLFGALPGDAARHRALDDARLAASVFLTLMG